MNNYLYLKNKIYMCVNFKLITLLLNKQNELFIKILHKQIYLRKLTKEIKNKLYSYLNMETNKQKKT